MRPSMVVHTINPSIQDSEAGGSLAEAGQPDLHSKFQANLRATHRDLGSKQQKTVRQEGPSNFKISQDHIGGGSLFKTHTHWERGREERGLPVWVLLDLITNDLSSNLQHMVLVFGFTEISTSSVHLLCFLNKHCSQGSAHTHFQFRFLLYSSKPYSTSSIPSLTSLCTIITE